jgi:hypothetical protein
MHVPDPILVVGSFAGPDDAREAMLALEARGFDADDVRLAESSSPSGDAVPTPATTRESDAAVFKSVGRRAAVWGPIGAVVGIGLVLVGLAVFGALSTTSVIVAVIVGGIFGFALGAIWAGAYKLPVNEDAIDTLAVDPRDDEPVRVEVRARDTAMADEAATVLQDQRATQIQRTPSSRPQ